MPFPECDRSNIESWVDHVQFGTVPEPPSLLLVLPGVAGGSARLYQIRVRMSRPARRTVSVDQVVIGILGSHDNLTIGCYVIL